MGPKCSDLQLHDLNQPLLATGPGFLFQDPDCVRCDFLRSITTVFILVFGRISYLGSLTYSLKKGCVVFVLELLLGK